MELKVGMKVKCVEYGEGFVKSFNECENPWYHVEFPSYGDWFYYHPDGTWNGDEENPDKTLEIIEDASPEEAVGAVCEEASEYDFSLFKAELVRRGVVASVNVPTEEEIVEEEIVEEEIVEEEIVETDVREKETTKTAVQTYKNVPEITATKICDNLSRDFGYNPTSVICVPATNPGYYNITASIEVKE